MRLFHRNPAPPEVDPEVARLQHALTALVATFGDRVEASRREATDLRLELAGLRTEMADRDRHVVQDALEIVRESGRQCGLAQAQAAMLADTDQMLELAGDLVAAGAGDFLTDRERTIDVSSRS